MTSLDRGPEIFNLLVKSSKFENGSLVLIGWMLSDPYTRILEVLSQVFGNIHPKGYALPIIVASVSIILYLLVCFFDFIYGLRASRHEALGNKHYVQSEKLWSTFYKVMAVLLVIFILCMFSLLCTIMELTTLQRFFMYAIGAFSFMAILYDIHSIGENYKRRFDKRLKIFEFLDGVAAAFNERIIKKIKSL